MWPSLCCSSEDGFCAVEAEGGNTMTIGHGYGACVPYETSREVSTVLVRLDLSLSSNVGVAFDVQEKSFAVVTEVFGGLLQHWNDHCEPTQVVKVLDRLVEVDGQAGSKSELCTLLGAKKEAGKGKLELKFRRPKEKKVVLQKQEGKEFGIVLNYFKSSSKIVIAGLDGEGLVQEWNLAHPELPVCPQDVIVAVNGLQAEPAKMVAAMKESAAPELTLLQY
ncbi:unnamed protein product [Effrenium voratum]|nr:unnamed protein product [Effrenium voratum]